MVCAICLDDVVIKGWGDQEMGRHDDALKRTLESNPSADEPYIFIEQASSFFFPSFLF